MPPEIDRVPPRFAGRTRNRRQNPKPEAMSGMLQNIGS